MYFIASSLWGIAERKMLPPVSKKPSPAPEPKAAGGGFLQRWLGESTPEESTEAKKARIKRRQKKSGN